MTTNISIAAEFIPKFKDSKKIADPTYVGIDSDSYIITDGEYSLGCSHYIDIDEIASVMKAKVQIKAGQVVSEKEIFDLLKS